MSKNNALADLCRTLHSVSPTTKKLHDWMMIQCSNTDFITVVLCKYSVNR